MLHPSLRPACYKEDAGWLIVQLTDTDIAQAYKASSPEAIRATVAEIAFSLVRGFEPNAVRCPDVRLYPVLSAAEPLRVASAPAGTRHILVGLKYTEQGVYGREVVFRGWSDGSQPQLEQYDLTPMGDLAGDVFLMPKTIRELQEIQAERVAAEMEAALSCLA